MKKRMHATQITLKIKEGEPAYLFSSINTYLFDFGKSRIFLQNTHEYIQIWKDEHQSRKTVSILQFQQLHGLKTLH